MRHRRVGKWPARCGWAQGHIASQGCSNGCAVLKGVTEDPLTCTATTMEQKPSYFVLLVSYRRASNITRMRQKTAPETSSCKPVNTQLCSLATPRPGAATGSRTSRPARPGESFTQAEDLALHHGRDAAQQRRRQGPTKRKRPTAAGRDAAGLLALFRHASEGGARDDGLFFMYIMGGPLLRLVINIVLASFEFPGTAQRKIPRL